MVMLVRGMSGIITRGGGGFLGDGEVFWAWNEGRGGLERGE